MWWLGTDDAKAVVIGLAKQTVISIDKLEVAAGGHLDAGIAGLAESLVRLTDIKDIGGIGFEVVERTLVGAVIDNYDFPFTGL